MLGDDIGDLQGSEALILCNHQGAGDVALIMFLMQRQSFVSNLCWIISNNFKWFPFGWVARLRGDFFLRPVREIVLEISYNSSYISGKNCILLYQGNEGTAALEKYMRTEYADDDRKWVVLFPEETILEAGSDKSKRLVD